MRIPIHRDQHSFFQCFSSKNKIQIMELLAEKAMNIGELAETLDVSSTLIARYISEMEKAGIVKTALEPGKRGQQKLCSLTAHEFTLFFQDHPRDQEETVGMTIPVGQFSSFSVEPTCGLASTEKYIGMVDDPRYFSDPEAARAGILWFESGYVDYVLPSFLFDYSDTITSLEISFEICSEYPRYKNDHPSDIYFSLNGRTLGFWTSPGSFGGKKGLYTPAWFTCGTEYGLLKRLKVTRDGTYVDGNKISGTSLTDLDLGNKTDQVLRIASPENVRHPGGVTLFGKGFGNHDQDINIQITY
ncbi:MAG: ArsR family transcriptional regulator [Spirochaetales bacterium]|nr:ArsR family transcriptional regulator [Spirochaetales bacterium]